MGFAFTSLGWSYRLLRRETVARALLSLSKSDKSRPGLLNEGAKLVAKGGGTGAGGTWPAPARKGKGAWGVTDNTCLDPEDGASVPMDAVTAAAS